ncbi:MAG: flavodoxin family protein, partial [Planctomycetota bacterium]
MPRIVGIVGSPREGGNTETLVRCALEAVESRGAETTLFHLGK